MVEYRTNLLTMSMVQAPESFDNRVSNARKGAETSGAKMRDVGRLVHGAAAAATALRGDGAGDPPHRPHAGSFMARTQARIAVDERLAAFASFRVDWSRPSGYATGQGQGIGALPMICTRA